jgi:hypothetical protein
MKGPKEEPATKPNTQQDTTLNPKPGELREHFHNSEDLHSYLIKSWNELGPEDRCNTLIFHASNKHDAARNFVVLVLLDLFSQLLASDVAKAQSFVFPVL